MKVTREGRQGEGDKGEGRVEYVLSCLSVGMPREPCGCG